MTISYQMEIVSSLNGCKVLERLSPITDELNPTIEWSCVLKNQWFVETIKGVSLQVKNFSSTLAWYGKHLNFRFKIFPFLWRSRDFSLKIRETKSNDDFELWNFSQVSTSLYELALEFWCLPFFSCFVLLHSWKRKKKIEFSTYLEERRQKIFRTIATSYLGLNFCAYILLLLRIGWRIVGKVQSFFRF